MRPILHLLATAAASAVLAVQAASPQAMWSAASVSMRGGAMVAGAAQPAAVDGNGDLVMVATQGDGSAACIVTTKYRASNGAMAWRRELCAGAGTAASGLALDGAGNAIVVGSTAGDFRLVKYAGANGAILWDQSGGDSQSDRGYAVALDRNGDVFMLGTGPGFTVDLWIRKHRGGDGALAWQQPVEGGADITPAGLAVDAGGNALVVGTYRNSRGDEDWHLAKLAGSSGAVLWRKVYDTGGNDVAAGLAVDGAGNPTVVGTTTAAGGAPVMRIVKSESATGRTTWERSHAGAGRAGASAVGIDGGGSVVVTGFAAGAAGRDEISTLKYGADGSLLWQATHAGGGAGSGRALALDGAAVLVTGRSFGASPGNAEIRTIRYDGSGAELWSVAHASGWAEGTGLAVAAAGGGAYTVGASLEGGQPAVQVIRYGAASAPAAPAAFNVQGLWWRGPGESGWGINLAQQGDILFATWFTYDEQGQPLWLVMSEGRRIEANAYEGTLYRTTGPAFNAVPFEPARVQAVAAGTARLRFVDADNGTLEYQVGGASGLKPITRQVYASPLPQCAQGASPGAAPNFQDLWWAPAGSESGWGLNITHQGDTLFITWFTYGGDGRGIWLVGSNLTRTGSTTYAGMLYRTAGPPFHAQPWNAAQVGVIPAGHATLTFTDANTGTFAYTLDGVTQSKPITRQVYATPKTTCR